ncbi:PAS domain-containing protein [Veronia pacifica]|uniref:PAS sensor domain-containing protein n=1 Tax=Veronia pacifica TaxID=1080227 RepID=A0A1C3ER46_9GAMM|nr:PAS domain S-box protein [Veronia pacifica]ODA35696.1 PAS sensor domain-containing protein [Veronia pacifica]
MSQQSLNDQIMTAVQNALVISKTDLEGNITYVNSLFCQLTGYEENELIGQPHNLVRVEQVPKEVYKNMWDTIKAGKIWTGIIPNKGKNGEIYVVDTTVHPIFNEAGEITEYISVRRVINDLLADYESVEFSKEVFDEYYEEA